MFDKQDNSGVSPVIGVILMVAVTVALVALVTVTVFDIGGDVSESPDATVQLQENSGAVTATVLRNENVQDFSLQGTLDDGSSTSPVSLSGNPGSTNTISGASATTQTDSQTGVGSGDSISLSQPATSGTITVTDQSGSPTYGFTTTTNGDGDVTEITIDDSALSSSTADVDVTSDVAGSGGSLAQVNVIANMPDGNSEVLTSTEVNN